MTKDDQKETPARSLWDVFELLSKFMPAILVAIIAFMGNQFLQNKQKTDSNLKLYTQLLANKENSENSLRKDMFAEILKSFLSPDQSGAQGSRDSGNQKIINIRDNLLSLELLSRNFHESLDMKPLFKHILMDIIRARWQMAKNDETYKSLTRELDRLILTAKRVTRKQREILEDVAGKLSLTIPLKGPLSEPVCTHVKPTNLVMVTPGFCPVPQEIELGEPGYRVQGVEEAGELFFSGSNGQPDGNSKRYFELKVRYVYPQWKQVYIEILTGPSIDKHREWLDALEDFDELKQLYEKAFLNYDKEYLKLVCEKLRRKYNIQTEVYDKMIENDFDFYFGRFLKNYYGIEEASFWLEYFDFPLVDNSFINSKQRYSVVLDGFVSGKDGEDISAQVTLLYYPASYAGLKEKSFYNNQLMNYLMQQNFFSGSGNADD